MKILLLGEYSGAYNNLSNALKDEGYEVLLVNNGDGYKSLGADIFIKYNYIFVNNKIITKFLNFYYILLMYSGFKGFFEIFKYLKIIKKMKNYDVVQLINPLFLSDYGAVVNFLVFLYLKKNNKKIFLSALGDDYFWVKYCLDGNFEYSIFDRLNFRTIKKYNYPLHYIYGLFNPLVNKYIVRNVNAIIPGLYDYYAAYKELRNCTEIVPLIIPVDQEISNMTLQFPIKVFHGWQPGKDIRKGNDLFDKALRCLQDKYPDKISYEIVSGIPYNEYIKTFNSSHIFIDQCYSQDCGVNALLGMSKGKVVLSGFEECVKEKYNIDYMPLINCKPSVENIFLQIENIILNIEIIESYSKNAIKFIDTYHNKKYVLSKYKNIWLTY